jgi:hypothetical protein
MGGNNGAWGENHLIEQGSYFNTETLRSDNVCICDSKVHSKVEAEVPTAASKCRFGDWSTSSLAQDNNSLSVEMTEAGKASSR